MSRRSPSRSSVGSILTIERLQMIRKLLSLLALFVCITTTVWAQTSSSASRQMALVVTPFLSCTGVKDIDFGTHTRAQGPLFTSATNYGEWDCDTDPGNSVNITFTLPSQMTNPQATGLPVPLTYGAT